LVQEVIEALRKLDGALEVAELDGKKEHITFRLPAELRA
jgi:4-hydroxy-3-methylbut-2-enyl diphosphate reductase